MKKLPEEKPTNAWLPDGLFLNQKSHFGQILEGLVMEDVL
jgi:hypothetical protein